MRPTRVPAADRGRRAAIRGRLGDVEPREIFDLIVEADELMKYARPPHADLRRRQARELLERAREAALAIGDEELVRQAERRLADLTEIDQPGRAAPTKCSQ